jgi:hypothetical protein
LAPPLADFIRLGLDLTTSIKEVLPSCGLVITPLLEFRVEWDCCCERGGKARESLQEGARGESIK